MMLVLFNPGQSGPGSNENKGVLRIPQSSNTAGTSPSDSLVSYPGHSLAGSYPSAEMQSVYSTAPADWAIYGMKYYLIIIICLHTFIWYQILEKIKGKYSWCSG